jgi:hypothetical protein
MRLLSIVGIAATLNIFFISTKLLNVHIFNTFGVIENDNEAHAFATNYDSILLDGFT